MVALSVLISVGAAYVTRDLAERIEESRGRQWRMWLAGAAVADGIGTWSTHFTGMSALRLPVPLLFDWRLVLLSLGIGIAGSAVSLWSINRPTRWLQVLAGGVVMGAGISGLHYVGMSAMRLPGMDHRHVSPALVTLAIALSMTLSGAAVYLRGHFPRGRESGRMRRHAISLLRGLTNPVMHYTAMAAVVFVQDGRARDPYHDVSGVALGVAAIAGVPGVVLIVGLLTSVIDRLQKQKALLDELFEQSPEAVVLMTSDDRVVRINRQFTRIFGYTAEQAVNRRLMDLLAEDEAQEGRSSRQSDPAIRAYVDSTCRRSDGSVVHFSMLRVPVSIPRGEIEVYAILSDVTERREAEEALRTYPRRLIRMQEEEGKRIALELHDEIGQALTSVGMMLDVAPKLRRDGAAERIAEARAILHDLTDRVRNLALDLRPAVLDDFGLVAALQWLFHRYSRQTGVAVGFETTIESERFTPDVEIAAYRIVQETLTNVARYAQVSEATVRVGLADETLYVEIADHGNGFDPASLHASSIGVTGIRERARILGGRLTIVSAPGAGTKITAELPIR